VLSVKEISRVARVHGHGRKPIPRRQHGAGPFPDTAQLGLASQTIAATRHGDGVPMLEANIGAVEVGKE
jgi:hypothetical protein